MSTFTENKPEKLQALILHRAPLLAQTQQPVNKATSTTAVSARRVARTEELLVDSAHLLEVARNRYAQRNSHNALNGAYDSGLLEIVRERTRTVNAMLQ